MSPSVLIAAALAALCFVGVHHEGVKKGYVAGRSDGYLYAVRDLCEGHMWVEGRKLKFDGNTGVFFDKQEGKYVNELDMDEIVFKED